MVIASTGGRPQLRFYLSIVIQIGENIPTNQGQLKNFRPIIKSLTSGDWSVIRILRDLRSGVGWRLGWMTCPVTWWPRTGQAGGTLTNERNVNVIPAQRIVFQDTSSERGREWRRWQDVVIVFVAGPHHWAISLAPSIMESCQAAISSSLPSLSLSLSLALDPISGAELGAQVETNFYSAGSPTRRFPTIPQPAPAFPFNFSF